MKQFFTLISAFAGLTIASNEPCVGVTQTLRAVFTYPSNFGQANLDWCKNLNLLCVFTPRVSGPQLSLTADSKAFIDSVAGNNTSSYAPVGLLVEDMFSLLEINPLNETNKYSLKNSTAALETMLSLKQQLMGQRNGVFQPVILAPQISYMLYYGNAMAITPFGDILALFEESGFAFWLMPVGRDDFVRYSAADYGYGLSNWYVLRSPPIIINANYGSERTEQQATNALFLGNRSQTTINPVEQWESLTIMQQGYDRYASILNEDCPSATPVHTSTTKISVSTTSPIFTMTPTLPPIFRSSAVNIVMSSVVLSISAMIVMLV